MRVLARINKQKRHYYFIGDSPEKPDKAWIKEYTGIDWKDIVAVRATKYKNKPCWLIELKQ